MEINEKYLRVCTEREVPFSELLKVANDIWDLAPEEQDRIREQKAKEFEVKYPLKKDKSPRQ